MSSSTIANKLGKQLSQLTLASRHIHQAIMARSTSTLGGVDNRATIPSFAAASRLPTLLSSTTSNFPNLAFTASRSSSLTICRFMATNRKAIDAKNAKRLKIQQKKKKNPTKAPSSGAATTTDEGDDSLSDSSSPFLQHQEWVKFQQSISVSGFQTGQVITATVLKKSRGGKQARRKREKELARLQQQDPSMIASAATATSSVATKFPAIRYSPEETQELLRQAYEALPERTGKRGNRNLRRQAERWKRVRKIRSDYKANMIAAHERRMEQRHYKRQRVIQAKSDAVAQREKDLKYQGQVLERWTQNMMLLPKSFPSDINDAKKRTDAQQLHDG